MGGVGSSRASVCLAHARARARTTHDARTGSLCLAHARRTTAAAVNLKELREAVRHAHDRRALVVIEAAVGPDLPHVVDQPDDAAAPAAGAVRARAERGDYGGQVHRTRHDLSACEREMTESA